MSRHARMHPEKYEAPDDWESREDRALIAEGRGDELSIPMPPPRRLTDSRLNPHGQEWTIEDALAEDAERNDRCPHGRQLEEYCDDCKADALADAIDRAHEEGKAIARGESC